MGTPHYPPDFGSTIKGINARLRSITTQAQSRKPFTQIKTAILTLVGSLVVKGGGTITVQDNDGHGVITLGNQGISPSTGARITGITVKRPDGTLAFTIYSTPDGSFDFSALRDSAGTIVLSDDGQSRQGLATPWLPMPVPTPNQTSTFASTTSTTPDTIASSSAYATHPRVRVDLIGRADAGTSGTVTVTVNGSGGSGPMTIPAGGNVRLGATFGIPGWGDTVGFLDLITVEITAQRTAGTGSVYVWPQSVYAVQS